MSKLQPTKSAKNALTRWTQLIVLGAVACLLYGQQAPDLSEMSARDMFRNAGRLFGKNEGAPAQKKTVARANPKRTTPRPKVEPRVEPSEVAENTNRSTRPASDDPKVIRASLEPETAYPLGLRYSFLKQQGQGSVEVDTSTEFKSGDRIRLTVESNDSAYLYLVLLGSSGKWSVLFPSAEIAGGNNHIESGHRYTIPAQHWFAFDEQVGEEKLFILLSREPQEDLEDLIYSLQEAPASQPAAQPTQPAPPRQEEKLLMAQAMPIDDSLIGQVRETVYARDLVFEKVDDTASGGEGEKAVYIVNRTGDDDSRVTADVTLIHK